MKKLFVFIMLVSTVSYSSFAQYHPTLVESHVWKGVTYGWGVFDFYQNVQGDSLIGDQHYMKVYSGQDEEEMNYVIGLLREDEVEQRIYIWTGSEEHLIYDFDVEAGDIVSSWGVGMEQNVTITNVETITIAGTSREKITFEDQWGAAYWIEGMGSIYGLLDGALGGIVDYSPVVTCFYNDNELIWDNPADDSNCNATLAIAETQLISFTYSPNPFYSSLRIDFLGKSIKGNTYVRIYDTTGAVVHETRMNSGFVVIDGLQSLSSGLYTLSLIQDGNHLASGRIMKL